MNECMSVYARLNRSKELNEIPKWKNRRDGEVSYMVLGSYPSSRGCMKQNKSKYRAKLNMVDHTAAMSCFVVDA